MSKREAPVVSAEQLKAAEVGDILWRNNRGACYDKTGRLIRYGLANDSGAMNEVLKSSDLIGIHRRVITQEDVGKTIGQFWTLECKRPGWKYKGTPAEVAQKNWIDLVISLGGAGRFTDGDHHKKFER